MLFVYVMEMGISCFCLVLMIGGNFLLFRLEFFFVYGKVYLYFLLSVLNKVIF